MSKMNAIGWFDIYVSNLDRAVAFYETVLACKLEPIGDPTWTCPQLIPHPVLI